MIVNHLDNFANSSWPHGAPLAGGITYLDDLGLGAVECEGGGGDAELAEVDAGEPAGGGRGAGDVVDDEAVDQVRLTDHLHLERWFGSY